MLRVGKDDSILFVGAGVDGERSGLLAPAPGDALDVCSDVVLLDDDDEGDELDDFDDEEDEDLDEDLEDDFDDDLEDDFDEDEEEEFDEDGDDDEDEFDDGDY